MKTYFFSVIVTAIFGGICGELLPEQASSRQYVKLVTGLCVLLALIVPAKDALVGLGDFFSSLDLDAIAGDTSYEGLSSYESTFESALGRFSLSEAERCLASAVSERFALPDGACRTEITVSDDGTLSRVLVCLSGGGIWHDPHEIAAYVEARYGCICDVAVE